MLLVKNHSVHWVIDADSHSMIWRKRRDKTVARFFQQFCRLAVTAIGQEQYRCGMEFGWHYGLTPASCRPEIKAKHRLALDRPLIMFFTGVGSSRQNQGRNRENLVAPGEHRLLQQVYNLDAISAM